MDNWTGDPTAIVTDHPQPETSTAPVPFHDPGGQDIRRQQVLYFITATTENVIDSLVCNPEKPISIILERPVTKYQWNNATGQPEKTTMIVSRIISWPGRDSVEAERFTQVFQIFQEVLTCLSTDTWMTLRDVYYRNPQLFRQQENVNKLVDDIVYTCRASRKDLHITAGTKGLVAGLIRKNRTSNRSTEAALFEPVPEHDHPDRDWDVSKINWILVVEKEATFKALLESGLHQSSIHGQGILVTGKGYPDLATLSFIHDLFESWKSTCRPFDLTPVYGLFDPDPHGLTITKTYMQGSSRFAHSSQYQIPFLQPLGPYLSDILPCMEPDDPFLPMTRRDRILARRLLELSFEGAIVEGGGMMRAPRGNFRETTRTECQLMLMTGLKGEIQILEEKGRHWINGSAVLGNGTHDNRGGVRDWLECKMWESSRI